MPQAHPLNHGSPGEGTWAGARWVEHVAVFEWLLDNEHGPGGPLTEGQRQTIRDVIGLLVRQGLDWDRWIASDEEHPFEVVEGQSQEGDGAPPPAGFAPWFPNNTEVREAGPRARGNAQSEVTRGQLAQCCNALLRPRRR